MGPSNTSRLQCLLDDEHVAKLVYTAHVCWEQTGDDLYLAVAARAAPHRSVNVVNASATSCNFLGI
jgi:hypothetical protein